MAAAQLLPPDWFFTFCLIGSSHFDGTALSSDTNRNRNLGPTLDRNTRGPDDSRLRLGQWHVNFKDPQTSASCTDGRGNAMRLKGKSAIVVGAGQTPGDTIGNGRATAILFAREGADLLLVDKNGESARQTQSLIEREGCRASVFEADVTSEDACRAMAEACLAAFGRIDVLHNNVGIGTGDNELSALEEADWDRILSVNLKSAFLACKHVLPVMRRQQTGAIINISSLAAVAAAVDLTAYKVSKAGINALTQVAAIANAKFGIRVNAILPGLIETPMAIESLAQRQGISKETLIRERNARVPLGGKMGTAWDVAHAALFLASDEARFITGVLLPVDGGQSARVG
jgi:NAD(P)-dependent dehydrogenase (short-subunit alcohol dehydrogenase family)